MQQEATASGNYDKPPHGGDGGQAPSAANSQPAALESPPAAGWTRQQDKLLELLLCRMYPRWDRIAVHLRNKTPEQAAARYGSMAAQLRRVLQAPQVETPPEWDLHHHDASPLTLTTDAAWTGTTEEDADDKPTTTVVAAAPALCMAGSETLERAAKHKHGRKRAVVSVEGRNRAVPWSTDEHKLFLAGIREHGVGKWQKLSREFVTTRNASQIASHYQKYSIRQAKLRRNECRRPSIHDINDDDTPAAAADHGSDDKPAAAAAAGQTESGTADDESADEDGVAAVGDFFSGEDGHGTAPANN